MSKGERREFEAEAVIHLDVLYSVGLRLTAGDAPRAEDLIQETFQGCISGQARLRDQQNFRAFLFEDLLRRVLKARGFDVTQIMNITDVDDRLIAAAGQLQ